jgi:hypothetical protein
VTGKKRRGLADLFIYLFIEALLRYLRGFDGKAEEKLRLFGVTSGLLRGGPRGPAGPYASVKGHAGHVTASSVWGLACAISGLFGGETALFGRKISSSRGVRGWIWTGIY